MAKSHFSGPLYVADKQIVDADGELTAQAGGRKQYVIARPEVGTAVVVSVEDISGGDVATCTLVRTILDYPRNLLYTLVDASGTTLEGSFTTIGTDQFGEAATETVAVDYNAATAVAGTQIFATITSIAFHDSANAAASDTASVGVAIAADVASFGLPNPIKAVTDVVGINWIDGGTSKTQNVDATSIVVARDCIRPEQTVALADDYIVYYESTSTVA